MKQIITQHGWGLNKYFWDDYKVDFLKNNWHWQDNERGYFSKINYQAKWIKSESKKEIRMTLCHSFGFHLMQKKILKEATHIVLINSFNNFLPLSNKRNFILRSLKRMETKIIVKVAHPPQGKHGQHGDHREGQREKPIHPALLINLQVPKR